MLPDETLLLNVSKHLIYHFFIIFNNKMWLVICFVFFSLNNAILIWWEILTSRCGWAGWGAASGALAGCSTNRPLHGPRRLGRTVGVCWARCPLQRLIQQESLLIHIVTLTAAAVRVTGVIRLRVVLREESRNAASTFRKKTEHFSVWEVMLKSASLLLWNACHFLSSPIFFTLWFKSEGFIFNTSRIKQNNAIGLSGSSGPDITFAQPIACILGGATCLLD